MYIKQFIFAVIIAILTAYYTVVYRYSDLVAVIIGIIIYVGIRFTITLFIRLNYWYNRRGKKRVNCGSCGKNIYRLDSDFVLQCHSCGWKAGLPFVRIFTRSVFATQVKRSVIDPKLGFGFSSRHRRNIKTVIGICLMVAVVIVSGVFISFVVSLPDNEDGGILPGDDSEEFDKNVIEKEIFDEINKIRFENGLNRLNTHNSLGGVAYDHSLDMVQRDFYSHTNPDGIGPNERIQSAKIPCDLTSENIAYVFWDERVEVYGVGETRTLDTNEKVADAFVDMWMNSDGHRENILTEGFVSTGFGIEIDEEKNQIYATQKFCW